MSNSKIITKNLKFCILLGVIVCLFFLIVPYQWWIRKILRVGGDYYHIIFLLCFSFLWRLWFLSESLIRVMVSSTLLGYLAGLFAYFGMLIFTDDGLNRLLNTFHQFSVLDSILVIAYIPFICLSWLFGMMIGMSVKVLRNCLAS